MSNHAFRDPGNLRHQVGLVMASITDNLKEGKDIHALILALDALAWTYLKDKPELVDQLRDVQRDYDAGELDELRYRMEEYRIYVHCLRVEGVIDRKPLSVSDESDYLGGDAGDEA